MNLANLLTNRATFDRKLTDHLVDELLSVQNYLQPGTISIFSKCLRDRATGDQLLSLDKLNLADISTIFANNKFFTAIIHPDFPSAYKITPIDGDVAIAKGDIVLVNLVPTNYGTHSSNVDLTTNSEVFGLNNFCSGPPYTASISGLAVTIGTSLTAPAGTMVFIINDTTITVPDDYSSKLYVAFLTEDASSTTLAIDRAVPVTTGSLFVATEVNNLVKGFLNVVYGSKNNVLGNSNTLNGTHAAGESSIIGSSNNVTGTDHHIIGKSNIIVNQGNYVLGHENNLGAQGGIVVGNFNNTYNPNAYILGEHNIVDNNHALALGRYVVSLNDNSITQATYPYQAVGDQQWETLSFGANGAFDLTIVVHGFAITAVTISAMSAGADGASAAYGVRRAVFKNVSATVTQVGTTQTIGTDVGTVPTITLTPNEDNTLTIHFAATARGFLKIDTMSMAY